jgi:hypothetical protein
MTPMKNAAIGILDSHRIMSISTIRPDGWPQTTIVGYANEGYDIFFLIFRSSQKFANILRDERVSIAIGKEPRSLNELKAVYAGARAAEMIYGKQRDYAWKLLEHRHQNLVDFGAPDLTETALMRASCQHVSVLDFSQGLGHTEELTLDERGVVTETSRREDEWARQL